MTDRVRTAIKQALKRAGWQLRRAPPWPQLLDHLTPATVVDVGAAYGTPELYAAFPDAYQVLIDPVREYRPALEAVLKNRRGELLTLAVGREAGEMTLNVADGLWCSSFSEWTALEASGGVIEKRCVEVTTLDRLWAEKAWKPPFVLKLDTEGHELEAVHGAETFLLDTAAVIAEVSVIPRFLDGYRFHEFIVAMVNAGFEVTDIIEAPSPSRKHGRVSWLNMLFERGA